MEIPEDLDDLNTSSTTAIIFSILAAVGLILGALAIVNSSAFPFAIGCITMSLICAAIAQVIRYLKITTVTTLKILKHLKEEKNKK